MNSRIRSGLPVLALGIALGAPQIGYAQEENPSTPGQIPNPGTYQGSQELQRQSDQQDQQFRQQQQPQSQQYGGQYGNQAGGQYRGQSASGSAGSRDIDAPHMRCLLMMERAQSLAPLRGLVELGSNYRDPRYFTISRRPTAAEKPILLRWVATRRRCNALTRGTNPVLVQANLRAGHITDSLIDVLAQGRMTYGEFNYRRAQNTMAYQHFVDSRQ